MSDQSPESYKGPPPSQGSGQYIAVAAILLLFIGGVVIFKVTQSKPDETPNVLPSASVKKTAAPAFTDTLPPIATDEPTASVSASASAKTPTGTGGGGGCSAECTGKPAPGFSGEFQSAGGAAKGCFKSALAKNESASGKISVSVRIDGSGNVCSASAKADSGSIQDITGCVANVFKSKHYSAPSGGCIDATMSINFEKKDR